MVLFSDMPDERKPAPAAGERPVLDAAARGDAALLAQRAEAFAQSWEGRDEARRASLVLFAAFSRLAGMLSPDEAAARKARERALDVFVAASEAGEVSAAFLEQLQELVGRPGSKRRSHPLVARAIWFIEENHARKLSLRDVSGFVNVSPNHLSSLFRKHHGMTLTHYLHAVRLRRAAALLREGDKSLSEIAYQVGYQNYRDFYRNFIKHQRSSPSRFRQSLTTRAGRTRTSAG